MKISVIIPAYNEEEWLSGTLEALLNQDYPDFEIIVVDNNSTDNTANIAASFSQVKLLKEEKVGTQYAREKGRLEAKGEIIANLDADCEPPNNWISQGAKYFGNEKVVAVSGPYDYYDATPVVRFLSSVIQRKFYSFIHFIGTHLFKRGGVMMGGNVFIRASALQKIGGYNTSILFYGDDTDTGNRLQGQGRILYKSDIEIKSSARRFKRLGLITVFYKYIVNFFWVNFFNKPYHSHNE